ncbi:MAG: flavin reductase family protein [Defluviitaleaceae bacterium]|nr:flavin reductase family protein [Defluviitaleaceae bacterium]
MKRKSVGREHSMCVQPSFIIGTYDENGRANFAPITWVSSTWDTDKYLIVLSMNGEKKTKRNADKSGMLSVNLVSTDMLKMMDSLGASSGADASKDAVAHEKGNTLDVPTLNASKWVYECAVTQVVQTGDTHTYFCEVKDVTVDASIDISDETYDLTALDPVVYSGNYYSIGKYLGKIGDFA